MSKGLEALSKIKSDHEIILFGFSTCDYEYAKEFDIIEKELKALEIIKEKQVDVRMFIIYDLENYNKLQKNDYCKLTKDEDDLLNEVLL